MYKRIGAVVIALFACATAGKSAAQSDGIARTDQRAAIDSLIAVVRREYVDSAVAFALADSLMHAQRDGAFANLTGESLARALTSHLYNQSHDKHIGVRFEPVRPASAPRPEADRAATVRRMNAGVRRVEVLPGNVGYLDLTAFFRPAEARETLASAMRTLRDTDALIIDVRNNGGGSPETVALLLSYLVPKAKQPLFTIQYRNGTRRQYVADDPLPRHNKRGRRLAVLTSQRTFSGGEGFAYLVQDLGIGEVIGEVTAGAANPGQSFRLSDDLVANIPNGKVASANRRANWEGTGVMPNHRVQADSAYALAYRLVCIRACNR
jgi:retinol-binding protein 3